MIAASALSITLENKNNLDLTPEGSSLEEYLVIRLSNVRLPSQMSILSYREKLEGDRYVCPFFSINGMTIMDVSGTTITFMKKK
jgi:hypothetical protein